MRTGFARLLPCYHVAVCPSCPRPRRQAGRQQTGPAPPPLPACHRDNNNGTLLPPCDLALLPLLPPLLLSTSSRPTMKACAATMTTTMQLFVVASVASPLVVDAKQADGERRACAATTRRCRSRLQMRDHVSIPTIGHQSRSHAPLSPPPHHPPIPFAAVRAPLAHAS